MQILFSHENNLNLGLSDKPHRFCRQYGFLEKTPCKKYSEYHILVDELGLVNLFFLQHEFTEKFQSVRNENNLI